MIEIESGYIFAFVDNQIIFAGSSLANGIDWLSSNIILCTPCLTKFILSCEVWLWALHSQLSSVIWKRRHILLFLKAWCFLIYLVLRFVSVNVWSRSANMISCGMRDDFLSKSIKVCADYKPWLSAINCNLCFNNMFCSFAINFSCWLFFINLCANLCASCNLSKGNKVQLKQD